MPTLTPTDILSIIKLTIYSPLFLLSFALLFRHGFKRASGWLTLAIFCLMRLMGSAAQLATISFPNNDNAWIMADVLLVVGLAPLLITGLGLIGRAIRPLLSPGLPTHLFTYTSKLLSLIGIAALVLVIIGATSVTSLSELTSQPLSNIGKILFVVVYAGLVFLTIAAAILYRRRALHNPDYEAGPGQSKDGWLIVAVAVANPLMLVRMVYSLLSSYAPVESRGRYSPFSGSIAVQVGMSVWEEMIIVMVYVAVGFVVGRLPKEVQEKKKKGGLFGKRQGRKGGNDAGSKVERPEYAGIDGDVDLRRDGNGMMA